MGVALSLKSAQDLKQMSLRARLPQVRFRVFMSTVGKLEDSSFWQILCF
jgi:hypothetical protein